VGKHPGKTGPPGLGHLEKTGTSVNKKEEGDILGGSKRMWGAVQRGGPQTRLFKNDLRVKLKVPCDSAPLKNGSKTHKTGRQTGKGVCAYGLRDQRVGRNARKETN